MVVFSSKCHIWFRLFTCRPHEGWPSKTKSPFKKPRWPRRQAAIHRDFMDLYGKSMVLNGNHMGIKWLYKYGYIKIILNGNNMCYTHLKKKQSWYITINQWEQWSPKFSSGFTTWYRTVMEHIIHSMGYKRIFPLVIKHG